MKCSCCHRLYEPVAVLYREFVRESLEIGQDIIPCAEMVELILHDPEVSLMRIPHPATGEPHECVMGLELRDLEAAEKIYLELGYIPPFGSTWN